MSRAIIPTEEMKFTEARPILSELLNRVFRREARIRLYKGSVPVAAIVSIRDLERLEAADRDREKTFEVFRRASEQFADIPVDELEAEIDRVIAEARAERRAAVLT